MIKILVPIDFSDTSASSLRYAENIGKGKLRKLSLLHCYAKHEFNRIYDFGDLRYAKGIQQMLKDFCVSQLGEISKDKTFIAMPGTVTEKTAKTSKGYDILVLVSEEKKRAGWGIILSERVLKIASTAQCPVLILDGAIDYLAWQNIWHIQRQERERKIAETCLQDLAIDPSLIKSKSLSNAFDKSNLWDSVSQYVQSIELDPERALSQEERPEIPDLLLLVSYNKDRFWQFFHDNIQPIITKLKIPVLVIQSKHYLK